MLIIKVYCQPNKICGNGIFQTMKAVKECTSIKVLIASLKMDVVGLDGGKTSKDKQQQQQEK